MMACTFNGAIRAASDLVDGGHATYVAVIDIDRRTVVYQYRTPGASEP
jgi:hypothetical protein